MNHAYVIDASVAMKWFFREEFSDQAFALYDESHLNRRPLYGPPNLINEVTNAVYQRLRRRGITQSEADEVLQTFFSWTPVQIISPPRLYISDFEFARDNQLPDIYDSLYVILAQMLNVELWTDDRRLIEAVRSKASWVRWIADYQLTATDAP